jgi:adenylate cyclase
VIEREFRYLVNLANLDQPLGPGVEITQGYLVADAALAIRVRLHGTDSDRRATLTVKSALPNVVGDAELALPVGAQRHEVEIALAMEQAQELWPLCGDRIITKTRHVISLHGSELRAEVDVFSGRWEGLVMAEVEFADRSQMLAFQPPPWCGADVTADPRFTNAGLALAAPEDVAELWNVIQAECGTGL